MSITGKGSLSIRRKDVEQQRSVALGFKNLAFAHEASAGDTRIDMTDLVLPSAMNSFTNPSSTDILNSHIQMNRQNMTLVSSLRGILIDRLSYNVADNKIVFIGFEAEEGEIFYGTLQSSPRTGLQTVDARPLVATGELGVGETDFNVGQVFKVNEFMTQQVGQVIVFRNGVQQFRCVDNDLDNEGNYIEVPTTGGVGIIIRFKEAPSVEPDSILVNSNGLIAEKPELSQLAEIENIAGQVDKLVEVTAAVSGLPESHFQSAPHSVDLKQFGDVVNGILNVEVPIYRTETINLTGVGDFTSGSVIVTKIGSSIILTQGDPISHASTNAITATEIIPEWARPANDLQNVHFFSASYIKKVNVTSGGDMVVDYRTHAGGASADTSTGGITVSYNVPGTGIQTIRQRLEDEGIL
jgi:hypothetical protein